MSQAVNAGSAEDIREGDLKLVTIEDKEICLTRIEDRILAFSNTCTHEGGPLNEGYIDGAVVTCPWHCAEFDVCNGRVLDGPTDQDLTTYPVEIREGEVYVLLNSEEAVS